MNILVNMPWDLHDTFVTDNVKRKLENLGNVEYNKTGAFYDGIELREKLQNVDVLITGWGNPKMDKSTFEGTNVKLIAHTGGTIANLINMDVYDTEIKVISGNNYYAESVAEGTLAYILFMLRRMDFYSAELKRGIWHDAGSISTEGLLDQTVGIVSLGAISKMLIRMAKPFRIKFKVYSTRQDEALAEELGIEYASLEEIFKTCKIISLHTASTPETYHMIDTPLFKLIQDGAIFINTSRGDVINEATLAEELKTGRFRALLDVYKVEPLPADSPLFNLDNVTLFPHIAGPTFDRREPITEFLIDDIKRFILNGKPLENEILKSVAERMTN